MRANRSSLSRSEKEEIVKAIAEVNKIKYKSYATSIAEQDPEALMASLVTIPFLNRDRAADGLNAASGVGRHPSVRSFFQTFDPNLAALFGIRSVADLDGFLNSPLLESHAAFGCSLILENLRFRRNLKGLT